ncbi:Hypothetical_protein [Hexamita inflata]|uniref:Hypothetical_protein n=1 Tax=Hexamita inflata TaxID=28002 RepID=A0AA86QHH4_9EUKA|nr:Hypothetical protein HINF_LOCUS41107 [Hexamita inflata]
MNPTHKKTPRIIRDERTQTYMDNALLGILISMNGLKTAEELFLKYLGKTTQFQWKEAHDVFVQQMEREQIYSIYHRYAEKRFKEVLLQKYLLSYPDSLKASVDSFIAQDVSSNQETLRNLSEEEAKNSARDLAAHVKQRFDVTANKEFAYERMCDKITYSISMAIKKVRGARACSESNMVTPQVSEVAQSTSFGDSQLQPGNKNCGVPDEFQAYFEFYQYQKSIKDNE